MTIVVALIIVPAMMNPVFSQDEINANVYKTEGPASSQKLIDANKGSEYAKAGTTLRKTFTGAVGENRILVKDGDRTSLKWYYTKFGIEYDISGNWSATENGSRVFQLILNIRAIIKLSVSITL